MITKIEGKAIVVGPFGLQEGIYNADKLAIEILVRERNMLHVKLFEQAEMDNEEIRYTEDLISQLTELIVGKCKESKP